MVDTVLITQYIHEGQTIFSLKLKEVLLREVFHRVEINIHLKVEK